MAVRRYWRINVTSVNGGVYAAIASMQLRESADGANLSVTGSGTASAQSVYSGSYPASDAFDANTTTTRWASGNGTAFPQWLKWDFGAGFEKDIRHLTIVNSTAETSANIKDAVLQYSDDDSNWYDWINVVNNSAAAGVTTAYPYVPPATISLSVELPTVLLAFHNGDTFVPVMPSAAVTFTGGDRIDAAMPMPTVQMYGPWRMFASLPMPAVAMTGSAGVLNTVVAVMPFGVSMRLGGQIPAALPMPTVSMAGTSTTLIKISATMPKPTVEAVITKTEGASVSIQMPRPAASMRMGGSIAAAMPMPQALMSGRTGSLISITAVMPMAEVQSSIRSDGTISIEAVMPMLAVGPWGLITAVMPMAVVSIIARSVVVVTYEAYAVNLKPRESNRPGIKTINEVTRYPDVPFDGQFMYQGNCYGWGPGGLYLIGGETDDTVPIPYVMRTHPDDFGSTEKKTMRSAYFGGRFGPDATITLISGKEGENAYPYTTPRGVVAQNHRQKFGRGIKDRYLALEIAGEGALELDNFDPEVDKLTRRI